MTPAECYLVGRLVPRTRPSDRPLPLTLDDTEVDDPDLVDGEVSDAAVARRARPAGRPVVARLRPTSA